MISIMKKIKGTAVVESAFIITGLLLALCVIGVVLFIMISLGAFKL